MQKSNIKRQNYLLFLILSFRFSAIACSAEPNSLSPSQTIALTAERTFKELPVNIFEDSKKTFLRNDNMFALLAAGGASIAMYNSNIDDKIADDFQHHRSFNDWIDKTFDLTGGPGAHFAATGLWYMFSLSSGNELNQQRSWTMLRALSLTGLTTLTLKAAVGNETPNGKRWAWPSGHTASSFTVASVLDEFYGPQIGIPAYVFASTVAWRMMETGDHWASDVVFGVVLGWVVGHTVAGNGKLPEIAGFKVLPYTISSDESVVGLNLLKRF